MATKNKKAKTGLQKNLPGPNWLWYTLFFSLLFIIFVISILPQVSVQANLKLHGVQTQGRVVDKDYNPGSYKSGGKHLLTYTFQINREQINSTEVEVIPEIWSEYARNSSIDITYLPGDPEVNLPTSQVNTLLPPLLRVMAVLIAGGIVLLILKLFRRYAKNHRTFELRTPLDLLLWFLVLILFMVVTIYGGSRLLLLLF